MAKFQIKELAKAHNMTQEDLAQKSGIKLSTIQRLWQNKGASEPRASTLLAVAEALNVPINDLYTSGNGVVNSASSAILPDNRMSLVSAST